MLLAAEVKDADHTLLEHAEKVLDVVCGLAVRADILATAVLAVIGGLVRGEFFSGLDVQAGLIGMKF